MNQHHQMREALQQVRRDIESLTALQNGTVNHIVKSACGTLDRVLQTLAAEPVPLVRLTDYQVFLAVGKVHLQQQVTDDFILSTAHAIMTAMERVNRRQLDQTPNSPSE